jgi:hypothetical protein
MAESSGKLHTGKLYVQFERRTEASAQARLLRPDTDESGEPQGFRKERPRYPLEGRGKQADVSAEGNIDGTQNPILYVHETRQNS